VVQFLKLAKENLVKQTNQKHLIKMVGSKSTCPKWHFGQVGYGGKKIIRGVPKFSVKKAVISSSVLNFTHYNFK
jgi:hypothetical protein